MFVVLGLLGLAYSPGLRLWRAAELLRALSGEHQGSKAPDEARAQLIETELQVPGRSGPIRAREYRRADRSYGRGLVLAHGVHYRGIDEKRLIPFARELARTGLVVVTPELSELCDYRISTHGKSVILDTITWLSQQPRVAAAPVGVLGFSFAGGLALAAAVEPELKHRLAYVVSVGGHHDLERVLRFFLSNRIETPNGEEAMQAHEYGLVVLLYQRLEHFVPPEDLELMRAALRAWLHEDRATAITRASGRTTRAAERVFQLLLSQRLNELAPELSQLIVAERHELSALSPRGRLGAIAAPVYLLHGSGDTVIPPSETSFAALELGSREHAALISPLLEHVEVSKTAELSHQLNLVRFIAELL